MKDEQFEILVSLIKETASSLKKELQEEIMGVRYALFHEANEIKQEIKKNKDTLTHVDSVKNIILKPKEF